MADVFEQNLPSKANLSVATNGDYLRVVGSDNNSYKQLVNDVAKKIIENYTNSSLAGANQSVKAALNSLNSKMSGITFSKTVVATETKTFTLGSNYRGVLFIHDSASQRNGVYMLFSTGNSNVDVKPISSASEITIDTSVTSKLSLTAQFGSRIVVFLTAQGNVSE